MKYIIKKLLSLLFCFALASSTKLTKHATKISRLIERNDIIIYSNEDYQTYQDKKAKKAKKGEKEEATKTTSKTTRGITNTIQEDNKHKETIVDDVDTLLSSTHLIQIHEAQDFFEREEKFVNELKRFVANVLTPLQGKDTMKHYLGIFQCNRSKTTEEVHKNEIVGIEKQKYSKYSETQQKKMSERNETHEKTEKPEKTKLNTEPTCLTDIIEFSQTILNGKKICENEKIHSKTSSKKPNPNQKNQKNIQWLHCIQNLLKNSFQKIPAAFAAYTTSKEIESHCADRFRQEAIEIINKDIETFNRNQSDVTKKKKTNDKYPRNDSNCSSTSRVPV